MLRRSGMLLIAVLLLGTAGCGGPPEAYYYLVARRVQAAPETGLTLTITVVRRFEKENWCLGEKDSFIKSEFEAECLYDATGYDPMFEGVPVGQWYALQRVGRFPPSVVIYEVDPPLPAANMAARLRQEAPHVLKFAAIHLAPAEVRIFSPNQEIKL